MQKLSSNSSFNENFQIELIAEIEKKNLKKSKNQKIEKNNDEIPGFQPK